MIINEIIGKCITSALMAYFIAKTLNHKKVFQFVLLFLFFGVGVSVIGYNFFYKYISFVPVVVGTSALLVTSLFIKASFFRKLIVYGITFAIGALSEVSVYLLWGVLLKKEISAEVYYASENMHLTIFFILSFLIIAGILYYIAYILWNRIVEKNSEKKISYFILFPVSNSLLVTYILGYSVQTNATVSSYFIILGLTLLCVIADFVVYKAIDDIHKKSLLEQQNLILEEAIINQNNYYNKIMDDINRMNKIRHDFKNQLQTAYNLFEKNDIKEGNQYIEQLNNLMNSDEIYICKNKIIASVVNEKLRISHNRKIKLEYDIKVPEKIKIKEIDLCSVYANLLDNAINASKANDIVKIESFINKGYLVINVKNSISRKKNKETTTGLPKHGLGLLILEDIKNKYLGNLKVEKDSSTYKISYLLKIK